MSCAVRGKPSSQGEGKTSPALLPFGSCDSHRPCRVPHPFASQPGLAPPVVTRPHSHLAPTHPTTKVPVGASLSFFIAWHSNPVHLPGFVTARWSIVDGFKWGMTVVLSISPVQDVVRLGDGAGPHGSSNLFHCRGEVSLSDCHQSNPGPGSHLLLESSD